jgi:hypothetical protein
MSKYDLFEMLLSPEAPREVKEHLPPTWLIPSLQNIPMIVREAQYQEPLYVKVDGCYSTCGDGGRVYKCRTFRDANKVLKDLMPRFQKALIQGYVAGQGVGVFLLVWDSRVLAEFMHRRLHEVPHTGGVSSFRESWWNAAVRDDAYAKVKFLRWQGVVMMEYRWNSISGQFYLMEMNGRFWGSLHLALYAGVDFPLLLIDAFHGHSSNGITGYHHGLKCRHTFPKEVEYVWSRLRDHNLSLWSRLWSIVEFFQLSLDVRTYSDLLFPGDRELYWESLKRFVKGLLRENK